MSEHGGPHKIQLWSHRGPIVTPCTTIRDLNGAPVMSSGLISAMQLSLSPLCSVCSQPCPHHTWDSVTGRGVVVLTQELPPPVQSEWKLCSLKAGVKWYVHVLFKVCVYIYIKVYIYIHVYLPVYIHLYLYIHIHTHTHIHIYTNIYLTHIFIYIRKSVNCYCKNTKR